MDANDEVKTRITSFGQPLATASGPACLVVIHSSRQSDVGQRYVLDKPLLSIGRGRENDIVLLSDAVSRRHGRLDRRGAEVFVVDLDSTNGTFVNDESRLRAERRLNAGDLVRVGDTVFKYLSGTDVETQYHEIILRMAVTDGLTNLGNRQQLDAWMEQEIARAQRYGRQLSVLLADIDHFKRINDSYGHLAGDGVLRAVASALQKRLRPTDRLGRYGGEEFCAILPDTSVHDAVTIAEQLRSSLAERASAADEKLIAITISLGAATWLPGMSVTELYRAADEKLYEAKRSGRNRVCC